MTEAEPTASAGRRAILTGGASGIGAALVRRLRDGGADVLAADVDGAALAAIAEATGVTTAVAPSSPRRQLRDWCRGHRFSAIPGFG